MNKNKMITNLNPEELVNTYAGGEWHWGEAALCYALGGLIGVGFYYVGTQQGK